MDEKLVNAGKFLQGIGSDPCKLKCLKSFAECKEVIKWLRNVTKGREELCGLVLSPTLTTLTTQIGCLAGLHCMYMYLAVSIFAIQRHQSCAFRWCTHNWSAHRTRLRLIEPTLLLFLLTTSKYGLKLIIPVGGTPGYTILICWSLCAILKTVCTGTSLGSWTKTRTRFGVAS